MALGPLDPNAGLQTLMDSYQEGGGFNTHHAERVAPWKKKGAGSVVGNGNEKNGENHRTGETTSRDPGRGPERLAGPACSRLG